MSVIENFAALSEKEQREFAEALVKTINSESIFTDQVNFTITKVEADDLTGNLMIEISHGETPIEVSRKAGWTCSDEEEASEDPGSNVDYANDIDDDAENAFKTLETVIDGYKVELAVGDVDEIETTEVNVESTSHEDSGIGDYEYGGERGYDSRPYIAVEGTLVKACDLSLAFFVEPDDTAEAAPEVTED